MILRTNLGGLWDNCTWLLPGWTDKPSCWNVDVIEPVSIPGTPNYEQWMYGHIPRVSELPGPPLPGAPVVQNTSTAAVPQTTVEQWNQWTASQRAALQYAEDTGSWSPEGKRGLNFLDLEKFAGTYWPLLVAVGAVVLLKVGRK